MPEVRSRFAPSPTGFLHIGGARTALFSWLFARGQDGKFLLRIEDTDRERSTTEAVEAILDGLRWLGLDWDEGPYFQSERSELYRAAIERLRESGSVYPCTCTSEELDEMRAAAMRAGKKPVYDGRCRERLSHPDRPSVIRFRSPAEGETRFEDLIKGWVTFANEELDDLVLVRSDGSPTYNFVVVVDDAEMGITHVIRGEDHLGNTPKQVLLYEALGHPVPRFGHVPLILGADRQPLSKRHGATSVTAYREMGYFPEALVNYLARLGWSHGDEEIFSRDELVEKFRIEDVGASAGIFNPEKLEWVNFHYMKTLPVDRIARDLGPFLEARGFGGRDPDEIARIVPLLRERARTLVELVSSASYFFTDDVEIDEAARDKFLGSATAPILLDLAAELETIEPWAEDTIRGAFERVLAKHELKLGKLAQPVRVAITGGTVSPGIFEVLDVLGRERSVRRITSAVRRVDPVH